MSLRKNLSAAFAASVALVLLSSSPAAARQGDAAANTVATFNASVAASGTKDLTPELFPALAAMEPPPAEMDLREASLMTSESEGWSAWETWAKGEKQQAVIAALKKVTDPKGKWAFNLKYGEAAADPAWVEAGLYVDLGKPELLAAANDGLYYLAAFDVMELLITVEAERLAVQKKPKELVEMMVAWIRFGRVVADRPFHEEMIWAAHAMIDGLERLRDIVCLHRDLLRVEDARYAVDELDLRAILPNRVRFPTGEKQALQQLIALTMNERGGVKPGVFAATMAGLSSRGRAVNRFAQAGYWAGVEAQHAGWFDTRDQMNKIFGDWEKRWDLNNLFDPYMDQREDWTKTDIAKFAMLHEVLDGMDLLFDLRAVLQVELGGTRTALAVVGYRIGMKDWPPTLPAVQPRYIQKLDHDPWFFEEEREQRLDFRFFVPIRDEEFEEREEKKPRPVRVNMGPSIPTSAPPPTAAPTEEKPKEAAKSGGLGLGQDDEPAEEAKPDIQIVNPNATRPLIYAGKAVRRGPPFEIGIDQTDFILFSVGPDGKSEFADSVGYGGTDVLIWPPLLTLERRAIKQGLIQAGGGFSPYEMVSLRNFHFHLLAPLASEVYDKASGRIDIAKLRERWTAAVQGEVKNLYAGEVRLTALNTVISMMAAMEPSMLAEASKTLIEMPDAASVIERDAKQFGLTTAEVKELAILTNAEVVKSKGSTALREKVKGGAELTIEDMLGTIPESVETMTQPAFEPYLKKILAHFAAQPAEGDKAGGK